MNDWRYGFIDKTGKMVIDDLDEEFFSEGLAAARRNDLLGFIDKTCKFVIEPRFGEGEPFKNGLA